MGEPLAASVGNCVARPGGPQQLLVLEPHAVVQPHSVRLHFRTAPAKSRQPAAAQRALAILRGQGLLPLRRAGHFPLRLQQLQKNLVRQPGQALAPVLLVERLAPPPQHLVLLRQLSDPGAPPQPQPAVLRRAADGHLGALGGHELAPRLPQVLAPEQPRLHVRGVKAPPLLDGRQGLPRLAPVEHACRSSTRFTALYM